MRYKIGDIIPLQLSLPDLKNSDVANPSIGWLDSTTSGNNYYIKAELLDFDCQTVIYSFVDSFCSDYWVSFDNRIGSVQTLFVNTNLLPFGQEFFRIRFTYYNSSHVTQGVVYTEPFGLESECENTIVFRGENQYMDCLKRIYYEPTNFFKSSSTPASYRPTAYFGWIRLVCDLVEVGYTNEKELNDNNRVINQKSSKDFELRFWPIAPYAAEMLNTILISENVLINNVEYTNFSDVKKRIDGGRAFAPIVTCSQVCEINNKGCE
jgi:hypothetical protein